MASPILQHSDQLVATIAKLPMSTFGTPRVKEVALVLAKSLNKAQGWSIVMRVKTIAAKAFCSPRTVQRALKVLETSGLFQVIRRKHATIEDFNFASVYKLGPALRSLFNQLVTTPSHGSRGKSLTSSKQKQSNKNNAPSSFSAQRTYFKNKATQGKPSVCPAPFDHKRVTQTHEERESLRQEGIRLARESAQRGLEKLMAMKAALGLPSISFNGR
ncbi:hypothetical protein [Aeromonas sp. ARM81]|jgi:AraC-like DNA-binding protein|uniref:hypothetical protein n=1 Tax=Aeromonas sp. ARM81 TaxID=1747384 RepID=UPI000DF75D8A|nr:hypothetical protein [Aeromonas sp. ARM81]RDD51415.1 hypothetical protein ASJ36_02070 [Aeromonas sp. ARM81]TNI93030.1 hypothetical protein CF114_18640 [Aeromonas veronii]